MPEGFGTFGKRDLKSRKGDRSLCNSRPVGKINRFY